MAKKYSLPKEGIPLITAISTQCKTPILEIKFSNIINAFYYPNSPNIPRYSVTCILDPAHNKEHAEFVKGIQAIEKNEKVDSILKTDTIKKDGIPTSTGKIIIKFQTKEIIPVFICEVNKEPEPIELEDELAKEEKVIVVFDILRYTKKNVMDSQHGISFKPTLIYFYNTKEAV